MERFPLRRLKLRPGEEHREPAVLALEPFSLGGQVYAASPVHVPAELVVQRATSGDVFHLSFATRLEGPCMRCLGHATLDLDLDATEYQASSPGADEELRSEYVEEGELDLSRWARDMVGEALPDRILCRPDCAGLCPTCGRDLNLEPHGHENETVDPRWAALEALRVGQTP